MEKLELPTERLVNQYLKDFQTYEDGRYFYADIAIEKLFKQFPQNTEFEDVLLKVVVINNLYNTNILGTYKMAKYIHSLKNLDIRLKEGDLTLINEIAAGHKISKRVEYSFATKYCNWHNQEAFAIYDGFVEKVLQNYKRQGIFKELGDWDLKNYRYLTVIIYYLKEQYLHNKFSIKDIDKFLWMYGREMFPPKYKNKQEK